MAKKPEATPGIKSEIETRVVALKDLKPAPYNPRAISDAAYTALQASLKRFGVVEPIVWNKRTGHVVGGHQRLAVLEHEGVKKASVVVVDLALTEEKALNLALNNPHAAGEFTDALGPLLTELSEPLGDAFTQLRLDGLTEFLVQSPEPPAEFSKKTAENVETEYRCPSCGYEWSGNPAPGGDVAGEGDGEAE